MIINLKVKTLDSQTHEFTIDNEITIRQFKDKIAEKTSIAAEQQRIIYCGRVLADEKQLKEYDVDGKVVHVAERPPPSARGPASSTHASSSEPRSRRGDRGEHRGMRNSPLFRALDGMVVGAMAIPMNAGNQQTTINQLTSSSSSFCMNRITVARHMLDCANNIAAYLEDPERGLNNVSLDILTQGRWTMESTVVEVGITDIPPSHTNAQNFAEVLQGAVSAALRQNSNTNVTVVQLPTVFSTNGSDPTSEQFDVDNQSSASGGGESIVEPMDDATIENVTTVPENNPTAPPVESTTSGSNQTTNGAAPTGSTPSSANTEQGASRQRTGTRVLAEVIQQMRSVQTRLNPFVHQYYEILQNEPTFSEDDTNGRENAQRLFDRVSEAFHYLSHAQHAISDLMLDVSLPSPRYLSCRPILVEQTGYVSSNNYVAYNPSGSSSTVQIGTIPRQQPINTSQSATASSSTPAASVPTAGSTAASATATTPTASASDEASDSGRRANIEVTATPPTPASAASNGAEPTNSNSATQMLSANHQLQVARLIQTVVNSAPIDADFHVQINAPGILSIGVPLNATLRPQGTSPLIIPSQTAGQATVATTVNATTPQATSSTTTSSNSNTNSRNQNQARVTTATHPTTSTQTRSTARPQVQVANIPSSWNTTRVIPANILSSFDRFLPCNSHHIHDADSREMGSNNSNANNANQQFAQPRVHTRTLRRVRIPIIATEGNAGNTDQPAASSTPTRSQSPATTDTSSSDPGSTAALIRNRDQIRNQLISFIRTTIFNDAPITPNGMPAAMDRAIQYLNEALIFLPQYDVRQYNSCASIEKLVRTSLPEIIKLINDAEDPVNYEHQLSKAIKQLLERISIILYLSIGHVNANRCWNQIYQFAKRIIYGGDFVGNVTAFLSSQILTFIPEYEIAKQLDDVKPFLVFRDPSASSTDDEVTPMETDPSPASGSGSLNICIENQTVPPSESAEDIPPIIVGSMAWHLNCPTTWIPIITCDVQRQFQLTTNPAPAFSDAYISGMSAKRRKLIQSTKLPQDVKSMVAESVRRAIQKIRLHNSSNPTHNTDEISNAIAMDSTVQASFCETLCSSVKERLKTDTDFSAEKFPHASKYFNKQN